MSGLELLALADMAHCVSGDFHVMHLNVRGDNFDVAHAFLKRYYEEAAEDYDRWAEAALMCGDCHAPNPNSSATRIEWQSFVDAAVDYAAVVRRVDEMLDAYVQAMTIVFEQHKGTPSVENMLQTRLEYWDKERRYFNAHRSA